MKVPVNMIITVLICGAVLAGASQCRSESGSLEDKQEVIIYNTYGYSDGDQWVIPMRVYFLEQRQYMDRMLPRLYDVVRDIGREERVVFRHRITDFLADSKSGQSVVFIFRGDLEKKEFRIRDDEGGYPESNRNGITEGFLTLAKAHARQIMQAQEAEDGWLDIVVISDDHQGTGKVRLTASKGLSVISDIDDTIKITGMPMGRDFVVRKTFFEEYQAAPGMSGRYGEWHDAAFHYVSGTPWQFYRPLYRFLIHEAGFPPGTFHMKYTPKNFGSRVTWRQLRELITDEMVTHNQKLRQISDILSDFPDRKFILVGDSGERDPEIYREIASLFPGQVVEIYIRDVVNDRKRNPERLEGMTVIPAETFAREQTKE